LLPVYTSAQHPIKRGLTPVDRGLLSTPSQTGMANKAIIRFLAGDSRSHLAARNALATLGYGGNTHHRRCVFFRALTIEKIEVIHFATSKKCPGAKLNRAKGGSCRWGRRFI